MSHSTLGLFETRGVPSLSVSREPARENIRLKPLSQLAVRGRDVIRMTGGLPDSDTGDPGGCPRLRADKEEIRVCGILESWDGRQRLKKVV